MWLSKFLSPLIVGFKVCQSINCGFQQAYDVASVLKVFQIFGCWDGADYVGSAGGVLDGSICRPWRV